MLRVMLTAGQSVPYDPDVTHLDVDVTCDADGWIERTILM